VSCCGGRRRAARTSAPAPPAPRPAPPPLHAPRRLRYRGDGPIVLRGAGSGLTYLVDVDTGPDGIAVDARDVAAFVATGVFEAADDPDRARRARTLDE
jgi:hypothetical protein